MESLVDSPGSGAVPSDDPVAEAMDELPEAGTAADDAAPDPAEAAVSTDEAAPDPADVETAAVLLDPDDEPAVLLDPQAARVRLPTSASAARVTVCFMYSSMLWR